MRKFTVLVSVLSLLLAAVPALAQEAAGATILDVATHDGDLSTWVDAVDAANLKDMLEGGGPFTVFAPTNEAFDQMLDARNMTVDQLLADRSLLRQILRYHVVRGDLTTQEITLRVDQEGHAFLPTLEGSLIMASVDGGDVALNENLLVTDTGTQLVAPDIPASNGVLHVIDSVLVPPSDTQQTAHIRIADFAPDSPEVSIYLNGEPSNIQALGYADVSGWVEVPAGRYEIAFVPGGETLDGALIAPLSMAFAPDTWTTIMAAGSMAEGTLKAQVVAEDYNTPLKEGQGRITVHAAIADVPAVDVLMNGKVAIANVPASHEAAVSTGETTGASTDDSTGVLTRASFTVDLPAGAYDLQIVPAGETEPVLFDLPSMQVKTNTAYFVAITGTRDDPAVFIEERAFDAVLEGTDESAVPATATPSGASSAIRLPASATPAPYQSGG